MTDEQRKATQGKAAAGTAGSSDSGAADEAAIAEQLERYWQSLDSAAATRAEADTVRDSRFPPAKQAEAAESSSEALHADLRLLERLHEAKEVLSGDTQVDAEFEVAGARTEAYLGREGERRESDTPVGLPVSTERLLAPGTQLGECRIERLIGIGGMGEVYLAEHELLGRKVAVKMLPVELAESPAAAERFRREIQTLARLPAHRNIVAAMHASRVPAEGGTAGSPGSGTGVSPVAGRLYLVMEYVPGSTLTDHVLATGPLPPDAASEYIRQAADGLAHAHEHGIIHRDVKPSNLLLTPEGTIKLLDVGLARLVEPLRTDALSGSGTGVSPVPEGGTAGSSSSAAGQIEPTADTPHTHSGALLGTVDYIAPEQAKDARRADARSDLYSLGCTFYYLLAGRPPFAEGTRVERLVAHMTREPERIESVRPDVPPEVAAIVRRLMAKEPDERYASAREVIAALGGAETRRHGDAETLERSVSPRPSGVEEARRAAAPTGEPEQAKPPGRGVMGLAGVLYFLLGKRKAEALARALKYIAAGATALLLGILSWYAFQPTGAGDGAGEDGQIAMQTDSPDESEPPPPETAPPGVRNGSAPAPPNAAPPEPPAPESVPEVGPLEFFPGVMEARQAASSAQCRNNLRQISVALHNYLDVHGHFPPAATYDDQGRPLLSWRVHLLPYLDHQSLYDEFHLDEPWDSEHNYALVARMPDVYRCPNEPRGALWLSGYLAVVGEQTLFRPDGEPVRLAELTDGMANTIAIVETSDEHAVPWTQPRDLALDDVTPEMLLTRHEGGFHAAFADGFVRLLSADAEVELLRALLTRNGGEVVSPDSDSVLAGGDQRLEPAGAATLEASINVHVWRDDATDPRRGRALDDPGALPLRTDDRVRVVAELDQPAYVYLLWIDGQGNVQPIYPWEPGNWDGRPAVEEPVMRLDLPESDGRPVGWRLTGPAGMETLVLLARETRLPEDVDLEALLAGLPEQAMQNPGAAVWFENGEVALRGPRTRSLDFNVQALDDPVLETQAILYDRLHEYFPLIEAASFANAGE